MRLYLREADFNMLTELAERTTIMSKMDIGIYNLNSRRLYDTIQKKRGWYSEY